MVDDDVFVFGGFDNGGDNVIEFKLYIGIWVIGLVFGVVNDVFV